MSNPEHYSEQVEYGDMTTDEIAYTKSAKRIEDFKPVHVYNHESELCFQIKTVESLICWINDSDYYNAFSSKKELSKYIGER
tara:strand:- start:44 stop:289 length:246 start_codon:yes stop_codon:yes gene_type:complete